jgi:hypothetical protein
MLINSIPSGNDNIFVAKYDSSGNLLWAKSAGGTYNDNSYGISTDLNENVLITGEFSGLSATFGGINLINSGATNTSDVFTAKYDALGNLLWAKRAGGVNGDKGNSVCTNAKGNVLIIGSYISPVIAFSNFNLANAAAGTSDVFVAEYDSTGNVLWAKRAGGASDDWGYCINTDATNGIYFTGGFFSSSITFGSITLTPPPANCPTFGACDNMFIVMCNEEGDAFCASALASGGDDQNEIVPDNFGNAYIVGDYGASPFIIGNDSMPLSSLEDIFVAKFTCGSVTGANDLNAKDSKIKISPNPFLLQTHVTFFQEQNNSVITIMNILGEEVKKIKFSGFQLTIEKDELKTGMYFVQVKGRRNIYSAKLIVQ